MVAQDMNIPYQIIDHVELIGQPMHQLAQVLMMNSFYMELFYTVDQLVIFFNDTYYILDINTPLEDFSEVFNFVATGGSFYDMVQDATCYFNAQEIYGKTFKQLLDTYNPFHLHIVPI